MTSDKLTNIFVCLPKQTNGIGSLSSDIWIRSSITLVMDRLVEIIDREIGYTDDREKLIDRPINSQIFGSEIANSFNKIYTFFPRISSILDFYGKKIKTWDQQRSLDETQ